MLWLNAPKTESYAHTSAEPDLGGPFRCATRGKLEAQAKVDDCAPIGESVVQCAQSAESVNAPARESGWIEQEAHGCIEAATRLGPTAALSHTGGGHEYDSIVARASRAHGQSHLNRRRAGRDNVESRFGQDDQARLRSERLGAHHEEQERDRASRRCHGALKVRSGASG